MAMYNSIVDAVNAHVDEFVEKGVIDEDVKTLNAAETLFALNTKLLEGLDSAAKEEIEGKTTNASKSSIADQIGFMMDILLANIASADPGE